MVLLLLYTSTGRLHTPTVSLLKKEKEKDFRDVEKVDSKDLRRFWKVMKESDQSSKVDFFVIIRY